VERALAPVLMPAIFWNQRLNWFFQPALSRQFHEIDKIIVA
jgi:hypothetical protein